MWSKQYSGNQNITKMDGELKGSSTGIYYYQVLKADKQYIVKKNGNLFTTEGDWKETFVENNDEFVKFDGKDKETTRYEISWDARETSNVLDRKDTIDVVLQDGRQTFEFYDFEHLRNEHIYTFNFNKLSFADPSTTIPLDYARFVVGKQKEDGTVQVIKELNTSGSGDVSFVVGETDSTVYVNDTHVIGNADSLVYGVRQEDGSNVAHSTTWKHNGTDFEDLGWFYGKLVFVDRTQNGGTDGTGYEGQGKYKNPSFGVIKVSMAF